MQCLIEMLEGFFLVVFLRIDRGDGIFGVEWRSAGLESFLINLERAIKLAEFLERSAETKPEARNFGMGLG